MHTRRDPVRIAHVLTSLEIGGAEMVAARLIAALDPARYACSVVCLRRRGDIGDRLLRGGIPVVSLDVPPARGALALAMALRGALAARMPDVVHTHNVSPLLVGGLALTGLGGVRLVHTKHGRSTASGVIGRAALRRAARRASYIAAVSADAARQAVDDEGFPAERVHVLYNGIDPGPPPPPRMAGLRAITVARLEAVKDQATLLRAARQLVDRLPGFHLDIVGDGALRHDLEELRRALSLENAVTFHGFRDDVRTLLDGADVFLLSSRSEGISLTLLEAMASGLPIVATRVGGNPEVVIDGETGVLVPAGDPGALAEAAATLLRDPARSGVLGRAGRARVIERFALDAMTRSYAAAYDPAT